MADAKRHMEIRQFLNTTLPDFELPCAVFDSAGAKVFDVEESSMIPETLSLRAEDGEGVAFCECDGQLVLLINLRRCWPSTPDGITWLALALDRTFFENVMTGTGANLTNSEYRLLACLLVGYDLKESAARLNASYDTKRKQLQVIFQKFEVTSQAALTRTLSIRLMTYFNETFSRTRRTAPERQLLRQHYGRDVLIHSVSLENGSTLPVWEFGARKGEPCLYFHGLLSPTVLHEDKVRILHENKLRWLVAPRFFAADLAATSPLKFLENYTDALGEYVSYFLDRPVTIVAASSGTAWATHFASCHPDLVERLVIAGAPYPPAFSKSAGNRSLQTALSNAMRQNPLILSALIKAYSAIARSPGLAARAYRHAYRDCPPDLDAIEGYLESGKAQDWLRVIGDHASVSLIADLTVNQRDWSADIDHLNIPVFFLQGNEDRMCPPDVIAQISESAAAKMMIVPNAGHHLAASHFETLAAYLGARPSDPHLALTGWAAAGNPQSPEPH